MKERFFFYGVDVLGYRFAVDQRVKPAPGVFPDLAKPPVAGPDDAVMTAELAADGLIVLFLVKQSFFDGAGSLWPPPGFRLCFPA
jgi:hypothetical protein